MQSLMKLSVRNLQRLLAKNVIQVYETERLGLGSSFASKSFIVTSIVFKNH